ncbi:ATP-binding protein, partial [Corynebacterium sphenisci]|uniref:ATP-binding protein n=1 Tax=Corynebacterium sphenisci TaxID=191493 RepID=UPI0026E06800
MATDMPRHIRDALDAIWQGTRGAALETSVLDFKEDPAMAAHGPKPPREPEDTVFRVLTRECICFATGSDGEAHVVLGVADKLSGAEAFTGTAMDPEDIDKKVFNNSRPNLRVETREHEYRGVRLLVTRIPEGLALYAGTDGAATRRVGAGCTPMTEEQRSRLTLDRGNPDWTARRSDADTGDFDPVAMAEARRLLAAVRRAGGRHDAIPETDTGLLRELGLVDEGGRPLRAADILFGQGARGAEPVRFQCIAIPGGPPRSEDLRGPLLLVAPRLRELITRYAPATMATADLGGGQEVRIPAFPEVAVDEVVSNALVHRDWSLDASIVVEMGPRTFRVTSPGGLPEGVAADRLLSTVSVPRNRVLMRAMRMPGLVEERSRGFDRMWVAMIRSGRPVPQV